MTETTITPLVTYERPTLHLKVEARPTPTIKSLRTETPILIWHNVGADGIEKIERRCDQTVVWYDIYRKGRISESINATAVSRIFWDNPA